MSAMRVKTAGRKYLYAQLRRLDFRTSVLRFLSVSFDGTDKGVAEWRLMRNEESLVPPMPTDLAPVSRLTCEIRELQQFGHCEHHRAALSVA
jgi:hypothetical protein